ncbi:hypothetical protein CDAR_553121 [Caerostris darwini]|uniref:Uncharacterized protein n=1 Tax=Caerostris darwini TaxID=1538125 RepID=A0AAV4WCN1_9ARAC|nr:hypothetical protein CDAR_553121 [Caerostris darwini]
MSVEESSNSDQPLPNSEYLNTDPTEHVLNFVEFSVKFHKSRVLPVLPKVLTFLANVRDSLEEELLENGLLNSTTWNCNERDIATENDETDNENATEKSNESKLLEISKESVNGFSEPEDKKGDNDATLFEHGEKALKIDEKTSEITDPTESELSSNILSESVCDITQNFKNSNNKSVVRESIDDELNQPPLKKICI